MIIEIPADIPQESREALFELIVDSIYDSNWQTKHNTDVFMSAHMMEVDE